MGVTLLFGCRELDGQVVGFLFFFGCFVYVESIGVVC